MKVIIIDDELAMVTIMQHLLGKIRDIEVIGVFQKKEDALRFIESNDVDIAFIDIMIGKDSGLDLARQIRTIQSQLEIVFVTSHREFAMDAYDMYPLDYMVKPVSQKRLIQTIERVKGRRETQEDSPIQQQSKHLIVNALGGLEVKSMEGENVKFISKKSQELFALLLLQRGRAISKHRVIDLLFPDMPLEKAVTYLNTIVYQLRKVLDAHQLKSLVRTFDEQYMLTLEQVEVDFIAFESNIDEIGSWDTKTARDAIKWETQFVGELYEGKDYPWAMLEMESLAIKYADFAGRLVAWLLENNDVIQATLIARKLVSRNELDIRANTLLLKAFLLENDTIAFHKHYEMFRELYRREVGTAIPQEMKQMFNSIKA